MNLIEKAKKGETPKHEVVRGLIHRQLSDVAIDSVQARDLDLGIIDFVTQRLEAGATPSEICKQLELPGGKNSKVWKKIQAYFRQGLRADAEGYLIQKTRVVAGFITKLERELNDALENGVPTILRDEEGNERIERVKGPTKELAVFTETYMRSVGTLPKLWKDYGAIGEKKEGTKGGQGVTIVVKTNVPTPTQAQVDAHRNQLLSVDPKDPKTLIIDPEGT